MISFQSFIQLRFDFESKVFGICRAEHRPPPASQHTAHTACTKAAGQLSANVSHTTSHPMISPRKGASFEMCQRCSLDQACETGLSQVSLQRSLHSFTSCCFVLFLGACHHLFGCRVDRKAAACSCHGGEQEGSRCLASQGPAGQQTDDIRSKSFVLTNAW